ncbi:MAG: hypothetical protein KAS32_01085 [Candidatus Peribacteraceae bacterium]|nr:hypothetical protein [Candidatus Peribacteraceae bacterium]
MGDEVILKDDGYNELEGVFNKNSEIPGDEITGVIGESDSGKETDDANDTGMDNKDVDDKGAADDKEADKENKDANKNDDVDKNKDVDADIGDINDKSKNDSDDSDVDDKDVEDLAEVSEPDLKAQLREQQRRVALTEAKLDTMARQQKADKDAEDSEDDEDADLVAPSVIEANQIKLNDLAETRGEIVADMLELMKVNPKYEDVEDVCSKTNLDDTIETLARAQVAKEGGDLVEIMMGLEIDIWSQRNPYSYMYGLIKDIHPRYSKTANDDAGDDDKGDASKDGKDKEKTPKKAPLSALDLARGGGGKDLGEWTAEKIDNLSETELNTVPEAVYRQYLRGDLDK